MPPPRPAPEWGTRHRHFLSTAIRVPFDEPEKEYLRNLLEENPHIRTSGRMVAMALSHIRRDRAARAIFHERHVLNTTRLKTGFAALERANTAALADDSWVNGDDDYDAADDDADDDVDAGADSLLVHSSSSNINRLRFFND